MTRDKRRQGGLFEVSPVATPPVPEKAPTGHRGTNSLNDLDPRSWLLLTKSVWYRRPGDLQIPHLNEISEALRKAYGDSRTEEILGQITDSILLSRPPARDATKALHPATFAEPDIERLIAFFTKEGELVLDPFVGSGSTLVACRNTGRSGVGVELVHQWAEIARLRSSYVQHELFKESDLQLTVLEGDAKSVLREFPKDNFSFIVTSPPYWSMLNKPADHKVRQERLRKNLPTRYSRHPQDLANISNYDKFLSELSMVFRECYRILKDKRYIAVIVSDFRDQDKFFLFHADIARILETVGFRLAGLTILVQDSKTLYPYGMPYAFVSNIHHQIVVIARKEATLRRAKNRPGIRARRVSKPK